MSLEQFSGQIPEDENADFSDSPVTRGEVDQAMRDLEATPDVEDSASGNIAEENTTFNVSSKGGPENVAFVGSGETTTSTQVSEGGIQERADAIEMQETPAAVEREEGDAYADSEARQQEVRAQEARDVERVRAELAEAGEKNEGELSYGGDDEKPPEGEAGGGGGGASYEGGRGISSIHERNVRYKTCERCLGSGKRFIFFRCRMCRGTGRVAVGESEKITTVS